MTQEEQDRRYLAWDACYNVREVGGYPVADGKQIRWRTLVRADNVYRLTEAGQAALRDYGVRTVIDLRLARELEKHPSPFAANGHAGPRYLNLPIHDPATNEAMDAADSMQGEYIAILELNKGLIAEIIKAVAANLGDGGVLVHCHGGKDRTGIIVAMLLTLAGVPREVIVEDYALSEVMLEPVHLEWVEEKSKAQGGPVERPRWMYSRPETMDGVLGYLDREYGGVEGYLEAAGVTRAEMVRVRERLVDGVGDVSG